MSDTTPEATAPEPQAPDDVDSKTATGVGVYDTTLQRFVGGKFASKSDADAHIKTRQGDDDDQGRYVTRKV